MIERADTSTRYEFRPPAVAEIPALADLVADYDTAHGDLPNFGEEDVAELLRHPRLDIDRDGFVLTDDDRLIAFGLMWDGDPGLSYESFGIVHRHHLGRGIGTALLASIERRASELSAQTPESKPLKLLHFVSLKDEPGKRLLENAGFAEVRRSYSMLIELGDEPAEPEGVLGIVIRRGTIEDAPGVHATFEEGFRDHWEYHPTPYEEWANEIMQRADFNPELWFLACDGDELVGVLWGHPGPGIGWVGDLAVRAPWRRRGIGACLLGHAYAEFYRRGFRKVGLGVDAGNEAGAVALYERSGMKVVATYLAYEKFYTP